MKKVINNVSVIIKSSDCEINSNEQMVGIATLNEQSAEFMFTKVPPRKKCTKNAVVYAGNYVSMRLTKDGSHRVTIIMPTKEKVSQNRSKLIEEFTSAVDFITE